MRTDSPPLFPAVRRLCRLFRDALPRGCRLSAESWQARHAGIRLLLLALIVGVPLAAIDRGFSLTHGLVDAAPAAVLGIAACFARRDARSWSTIRDPLTKLANRTLLTERIDAVLSQHRSAAVLFIDLCGFKRVNDVLGYEAGDTILVEVADRLRKTVRAQDTVARFGGDEFVIVLVDATEATAQGVAARIDEALAEPVHVKDMDLRVAASVGIALAGVDGDTSASLLRSADMSMYSAKRQGRGAGVHEVFTPAMEEEARARLTMETDLRFALERDELSLVYQPVLDMRSGKLRGFEALLRWESSVHGSVSPADFIPLAEDTGLIVPIGEWVLAEATSQVARWRSQGWHDGLSISVNVSTRQLTSPTFHAHVHEALRRSGIRPSSLVLEMTESALAGNDAVAAFYALKGLGVGLALDDFGTGYSSLSYLARLPIDVIKIDKCFTDDVPGGMNEALTAAVFAMADRLGISTVVEGVEQDEQVAPLLGMGARYGQGYLFSRPLAPAAAADLIKAAAGGTPAAPSVPTPAPPRVLVVEDDDALAGAMERHLGRAGCEVDRASTIDEAWAFVRDHRPGVVFCDINLHDREGWELIEGIRADANLAGLKVVVVTGLADMETRRRAALSRCSYIGKSNLGLDLRASLEPHLFS